MFGFTGIINSQVKKTDMDKGIPFPNENIQAIAFLTKTFMDAETVKFQLLGLHVKIRQESRTGKSQFGASGTVMLNSIKTPEGVLIKDKMYGGGLSFATSNRNSWTDYDIGINRLERSMDINQDLRVEERINYLNVRVIWDFRKKFHDGFQLSGTKIYFEYLYPLSGQKQDVKKGLAEKVSSPSNIKALYTKIEPTWYYKRLSPSWAMTSFFLLGYDHQSWNVSDNYSVGAGVRFYIKEIEVIIASFKNRFRPNSVDAGETTFEVCANIWQLINEL